MCRYDFAPSNKVVGSRIECHATEDFSTSANRTADLVFITRKDGTLSEKLRIDSDGNIWANKANPQSSSLIILDKDGSGEAAIRFYNAGSNTAKVALDSSEELTFDVNGGERLRIKNTGEVGIGGIDPAYPLEVSGDGGGAFAASTNSAHGQLSIVGKNSSGQISAISRLKSYPDGSSSQSHFAVETRNSSAAMVERLRIKSDGKVGINTTTNINGRLHVQHDAPAENILYASRYNDQQADTGILAITEAQMTGMPATGLVIGNHNRDMHIGPVFDSSATVTTTNTKGIRITSTGNVGIGLTNPDQRFKIHGNIELNAYEDSNGQNGYKTSGGLIIGNAYDAGKSSLVNADRNAIIWQERGLDIDFGTTDIFRMKIDYNGNVGINTTLVGSQTWRSGRRLEIFGGGGNVTGELHLGANRGDGAQSVGSINFFDNTQDSTHRHIAIIEADKTGSTSNKRGGDLLFYTKGDNVAAPTVKLRITKTGEMGLGTQTPPTGSFTIHLTETPEFNLYSTQHAQNNNCKINFGVGQSASVSGNTGARIEMNIPNSGGQMTGELKFHTNQGDNLIERLRIASNGDVIIGSGGAWSYPKPLNVQGSSGSILSLYNGDTDSYAADTNSSIEFKLLTGNTGNQVASCEIRAFKENGNNGDSARALSFYTGVTSGSPAERLRIASDGIIKTTCDTDSVFKFNIDDSIGWWNTNTGLAPNTSRTWTITNINYGGARILIGGGDGNYQRAGAVIEVVGTMWSTAKVYYHNETIKSSSGASISTTYNNNSIEITVASSSNWWYYSMTVESHRRSSGAFPTVTVS